MTIYNRFISRKRASDLAMSLLAKIFVLLCMLTLAWAWPPKTSVKITNTLEGNENLNIHCKSKDDDLGMHLLHINENLKWSFGTNFFGRTQFFCSCEWGKGPLLYFDAYIQSRDYSICIDCHWYIKKDGPCRYEESGILKCFKWNP